MKKMWLCVFIIASGCAASTASLGVEPKIEPKIWQECTDITPEDLIERETRKAYLNGVYGSLSNEKIMLAEFLTEESGRDTSITFKSTVFSENYQIAVVSAELLQGEDIIGNLYILLGNDKKWKVIGLKLTGKIKTQIAENTSR